MRAPPSLPDLRPTEDVVWQAGQHWLVPARRAMPPALLALGALVAIAGTAPLRAGWPWPWSAVAVGLLGALGALALGRLAWIYLDWVDNLLLVTTERVIWLQKTAFFHEVRREMPLNRVQNVAVAIGGPLARRLDYGDVVIDAAGAPPIVARAVPRPQGVRRRIFDLQARQRDQREQQDRAALDTAVRQALGLPRPAPGPAPPRVVIHLPGEALAPPPQPGEADRLVWRRHWWSLVATGARPAGVTLLAGLGALLAPRAAWLPGELTFLATAALVGGALLGLVGLAWTWLAWREEVYILDGDRLLDIAGLPFGLRREVKETHLARVQDVSYRIPHPLAHLLDFGDVLVLTGGESQRFTFDGVAHPRAVHATIGHRLAAAREGASASRQRQTRAEVLSLLGSYHRLAHPSPDPPDAGRG